MMKKYFMFALATVTMSVALTASANPMIDEQPKQTMAKVDTEAMGRAWDDHSVDRRPAVEDRNFTSEAVVTGIN